MTPHSSHPRAFTSRTLVRRFATFVVAGLALGGIPLVAHAISDDAQFSTNTVSEREVTVSRRAATLPEITGPATVAQPAPQAEPAATPEPAERATAPTEAESALEAAIMVVTDTYAWDERGSRVEALQRTLGVTADGWYAHATQRAHRLALESGGFPTDSLPAAPVPAGPSQQQWEALRQCESGGDYSITNRSGTYRGAYQFDRPTWDSVASQYAPHLVGVDPAAASPADQDAMALALYTERGSAPWPHCGRHLR